MRLGCPSDRHLSHYWEALLSRGDLKEWSAWAVVTELPRGSAHSQLWSSILHTQAQGGRGDVSGSSWPISMYRGPTLCWAVDSISS